MGEEYLRKGRTRTTGYSKLYHELFDLYHPYIGDKATLYYTVLLRYRNNAEGTSEGKSWIGRKKVSEEFNLNFAQLKRADAILEAFDLIRIEKVYSGRGRPKNVYYVNHPLEAEEFPKFESEYVRKLKEICTGDRAVINMLGKENKPYFYAY